MSTVSQSYRASADLTFTSLASLASSSSFLAGAESTAVDNTTDLDLDKKVSGHIKVGTTPTTNTQIQIWIVAEMKDGTWPDVFDGTDSAETWTNAEMRDAGARLGAVINIIATTSNLLYPFEIGSIAALFGGYLPPKFVVWVTHNTVAALNSSGSVVSVFGRKETIA